MCWRNNQTKVWTALLRYSLDFERVDPYKTASFRSYGIIWLPQQPPALLKRPFACFSMTGASKVVRKASSRLNTTWNMSQGKEASYFLFQWLSLHFSHSNFPYKLFLHYICIRYVQSRNLRNLKITLCILRILKLRDNLKIAQPILRLRNMFAQSRNCTIRLRNLKQWAHGVRASELTNRRELRTFRDGACLEHGHSTGLGSLCSCTQTEGKGVSPSWWTSQKPLVREFEYTCPTLKVTTELQELITYVSYLYIRWKLEGFNCAHYRNCAISRLRTVLHDLEITHWCHAVSRLRKPSAQSRNWHAISGFWECTAQSWDCANS